MTPAAPFTHKRPGRMPLSSTMLAGAAVVAVVIAAVTAVVAGRLLGVVTLGTLTVVILLGAAVDRAIREA